MRLKKIFTVFSFALALLHISGCAQMVPLSGGDKDETPPIVTSQSPPNKTVHFSGNEIKIEFDEYIQLRDIQNQLIITPRLPEEPEVVSTGKGLKMKFRQPLEPNTTYNINFGASVADVHEGNILQGLSVIFSTGAALDSLSVSGKIYNAFTLMPQGEVSVFLYSDAPDSAVFRQKPDYYTKVDKQGNFRVDFIKKGNYRIIALEDKNRNFFYGQSEELVSNYFETRIDSSLSHDFYVFRESPSGFFVKRSVYPMYGQAIFIFNRELDSIDVGIDPSEKSNIAWFASRNRDTLRVFYKKQMADTVSLLLTEKGKLLDTLHVSRQTNERMERDMKMKRLSPRIRWAGVAKETGELVIELDMPLVEVNNEKIRMIRGKDTLAMEKEFRLEAPSLKISSTQKLDAPFEGTLLLLPGAVKSFAGIANDTLRYGLEIKPKEDFGSVNTRLELPGKEAYVVQLVNEKGGATSAEAFLNFPGKEQPSDKRTVTFERVVPGNYTIRVIADANLDKKWSAGDVLKKITPEKVFYYSRPVKILADWEIDVDWKVEE